MTYKIIRNLINHHKFNVPRGTPIPGQGTSPQISLEACSQYFDEYLKTPPDEYSLTTVGYSNEHQSSNVFSHVLTFDMWNFYLLRHYHIKGFITGYKLEFSDISRTGPDHSHITFTAPTPLVVDDLPALLVPYTHHFRIDHLGQICGKNQGARA